MSATFLITAIVMVATPGTGALFTVSSGLARGGRAWWRPLAARSGSCHI